MRLGVVLATLFFVSPLPAQQSTSFKLVEQVVNAGGHPRDGTILTSASFRITLGALGEAALAAPLASASFAMEAGFVASYPPPGEVLGLHFEDPRTLIWSPERSAGSYNLYRDSVSNLAGLGFGSCEQPGLTDETATDSDAVPAGDGYFYLVTVVNRLSEEGTKGTSSNGAGRGGTACP